MPGSPKDNNPNDPRPTLWGSEFLGWLCQCCPAVRHQKPKKKDENKYKSRISSQLKNFSFLEEDLLHENIFSGKQGERYTQMLAQNRCVFVNGLDVYFSSSSSGGSAADGNAASATKSKASASEQAR